MVFKLGSIVHFLCAMRNFGACEGGVVRGAGMCGCMIIDSRFDYACGVGGIGAVKIAANADFGSFYWGFGGWRKPENCCERD
jgi:hypothetical protein